MPNDGRQPRRALAALAACWGLLVFPSAQAGHDATDAAAGLPTERRVPGGIAVLELGAGDNSPGIVTFEGRRVPVVKRGPLWYAVVGLALDATPGPHVAMLQSAHAGPRELHFTIKEKRYEVERLTVAPRHVEPSPEDLERIATERIRIDRALETFSPGLDPRLRMTSPVQGRRSNSYGSRRYFNGQPRSPHSGMDIAASEGTTILSPDAGRIVETGDFFFNGRSVFVDHGQGVVTMYCHLSRIDVKTGDVVAAGTPIGLVGATGRVTGPHLHWGVAINRAMVDPSLVLVD